MRLLQRGAKYSDLPSLHSQLDDANVCYILWCVAYSHALVGDIQTQMIAIVSKYTLKQKKKKSKGHRFTVGRLSSRCGSVSFTS